MVVAEDTIVAISTASGRAAISVVRLSGPRSHDIARRCLSVWPERPRVTRLADVRDPLSSSVIDQAIAESRAALKSEPQSARPRDSHLEGVMKKVNVLQDTIALMNHKRMGDAAGAAQIDPANK